MPTSIETVHEVWRHYVANKSLPDAVLREPVHRAWERCDQSGASPHVMHASTLSERERGALIEQERDLIETARPYMHALSQAAGNERHAAMLGDRNAIVLDVLGDEASVHGPERVPGPGSLLSEGFAGSNGIGSPLAEGGYIELVGPEHFIEGFHPFTCQGLPLTGPSGETVGVLSTSVRRPEAGRRIREIIIGAGHGIEAELVRRRLESDLQRLISLNNERPLREAILLEGLWEDVVQLQGSARLWLERAVRHARSSHDEDAARLVGAVNSLIGRFQRQSELWRQIAGTEVSPPAYLDLRRQVEDVAALLANEAGVRGIELELEAGEPIQVYEDAKQLLRSVFRAFLDAMNSVAEGSTLRATVAADDTAGLGLLRFVEVSDAIVAARRHPRIKLHEIREFAGAAPATGADTH